MPGPAGTRLDDGHSTTITFELNTTASLWEVAVTPPGVDGGEPVDITTMRNLIWRTMNPRKLKTLTPANFSAAYESVKLVLIGDMVNKNQLITVTFPNGSTLVFWGYLQRFEPQEIVEGQQPRANCVIQPTNHNNAGVEVGPTVTNTTSSTATTTSSTSA